MNTKPTKHTPEPWRIVNSNTPKSGKNLLHILPVGVTISEHAPVARFYDQQRNLYRNGEENATRIVQCVNACAGMDDPAAEIAELKRKAAIYTGLMEVIHSDMIREVAAKILDLQQLPQPTGELPKFITK